MLFIESNGVYRNKLRVSCGETLDCFFAFCNWNGKLVSVHRRHFMFSPNEWADASDGYSSRIIVTEWEEEEGGLTPAFERDIGSGNDPRITLVSGAPIAVFSGAINSENKAYLYNFESDILLAVSLKDEWFNYGKNWVPFETEGSLGIVHEFNPFRVLKVDVKTGAGIVEYVRETQLFMRSKHDNYNTLRGGSNGVSNGEGTFGVGHATHDSYRHTPFYWMINEDLSDLRVFLTEDFNRLSEQGYGIIDPVSLFQLGDKTYLSLCCSERDWFYDQTFLNLIVPITYDAVTQRIFVDPDIFICNEESKVIRKVACDVKSDMVFEMVPYGGKSSRGGEGYLICGPYESIDTGRYKLVLRYSSDTDEGELAALLDVTLCCNGQARPIFESNLNGSGGKDMRVEFVVDIIPQSNEMYEVRVFVKLDISFTVYDYTLEFLGDPS
ncbi:MAG: hypothetical protein V7784_19320 [Oceanospirillaceae bacterium]